MLEYVHFDEKRITAGTYKDNSYISIDLGEGKDVYNSLRLDQAARVAHVVNEDLLGATKTLLPVAVEAGTDGIKLITIIAHKSFLEQYATPTRDQLEVYTVIVWNSLSKSRCHLQSSVAVST